MSKPQEEQPKFLPPEWWLTNEVHYGSAEAERSRSERLIAENQALVEESDKTAQRMQQDVNKKLEQRIQDIKFWKEELNKKLEEIVQEIDVLLTFKTRVERTLESCSEPLRVTLQCLAEREKRVGIDLVHDDVERELLKEREVIEGVTALLHRTLEQTNEQIRLNRSVKRSLEIDLRAKFQAEQIDDYCSILTSTSPNLLTNSKEMHITALSTTVTPEEWQTSCNTNISKAERERNNSLSLRALLDSLLEQTVTDMQRQHQAVTTALDIRIQETKSAKEQLEEHLAKILAEMSSQESSQASLRVATEAKQRLLILAQTRLEARSQRPRPELCHDPAQTQLLKEVQELSSQIKRLNVSVSESEMEIRALTRSQLSLEEQIQVKSHTLYIDEVICKQLLQPVVFNKF